MVEVLLSLMLVSAVATWVAAYLVWRRVQAAAWTYLTSPVAGTPSPFAVAVQAIGRLFGAEVAQSITASLMGAKSGAARAIDGMMGEVAGDALAARNPILDALLSASPGLRKRITRNPLAALALSSIDLSKVFKAGASPDHSGGTQAVFKL